MKEHNHGSIECIHITPQEFESLLQTVTRDKQGLMPAQSFLQGLWVKPPKRSSSPGQPGMRAFDDDYFYCYFDDNKWKKISLEDW